MGERSANSVMVYIVMTACGLSDVLQLIVSTCDPGCWFTFFFQINLKLNSHSYVKHAKLYNIVLHGQIGQSLHVGGCMCMLNLHAQLVTCLSFWSWCP